MEIAIIYNARHLPRDPIPQEVLDTIAKLKITFRPSFRRRHQRRSDYVDNEEWRKNLLSGIAQKLREKDDKDYTDITGYLNKITKDKYEDFIELILSRLEKRDDDFRLRVTTALFDRGIRQPFFTPMMAEIYKDISKAFPDALNDLKSQIQMVDQLYDLNNVISVPNCVDKDYNENIIKWNKQKELKRGFAVYLVELYIRDLIDDFEMYAIVGILMTELQQSLSLVKTEDHVEHVDALVRFMYAVAKRIPIKVTLQEILKLPKDATPSLSMKSRFRIEDAIKLSR
jgi:hypothetical protein